MRLRLCRTAILGPPEQYSGASKARPSGTQRLLELHQAITMSSVVNNTYVQGIVWCRDNNQSQLHIRRTPLPLHCHSSSSTYFFFIFQRWGSWTTFSIAQPGSGQQWLGLYYSGLKLSVARELHRARAGTQGRAHARHSCLSFPGNCNFVANGRKKEQGVRIEGNFFAYPFP